VVTATAAFFDLLDDYRLVGLGHWGGISRI
jgi:hypothetical protein